MAAAIYEAHPLFEDVQLGAVFPDSKTFVDCIPLQPLPVIVEAYHRQCRQDGFDLAAFVSQYFNAPLPAGSSCIYHKARTVEEHLVLLWEHLTRLPVAENSSLIQLPLPYIVPGGRFGEAYYWDSFFTMLGLPLTGQTGMLENMVDNFAYLIRHIGYIPNGNRTYYLGRSQPPFFAQMVRLLMQTKGKEVLPGYLEPLELEYTWWMSDAGSLTGPGATLQVVRMPGGEYLNRYWDIYDTPRPEAYRQDIELAAHSSQPDHLIYRHLRAGAASGWDFSSRWFIDPDAFASINTTNIIPVDLNCLLYELEQLIAYGADMTAQREKAIEFRKKAKKRAAAIQHYCWDDKQEFYFDYSFVTQSRSACRTLAATFPLFARIATAEQAMHVARQLTNNFLKPGGLLTTLHVSGQQWDAPNGWAPLQWMAIQGLETYGFTELAREIATRWISLNRKVYQRSGKMMEKYNVVDTGLDAGGGEYVGQDGFGWTNGVYLDLAHRYRL
ncbi:MAG: alpha,alpha-trehalase TreF [Chitinophagaceae bacterium]